MSLAPAAPRLRRALIVMAGVGAIASATAATPVIPEPDPQQAQLIVIRTKGSVSAWLAAKVRVDGKQAIMLGHGRYTMIPVAPGPHRVEIVVGEGAVFYDLAAEAGSQHFLHYQTDQKYLPDDRFEATWFIKEVAREAALELIAACKWQAVRKPKG